MTDLKTLLIRLKKSTFFSEDDKAYWQHALEHSMSDAQVAEFETILTQSESYTVDAQLADLNRAATELDEAKDMLNTVLEKHNLPAYAS